MGSKKAENLVYIHSTLRLLSRVDPTYMEGPSAKWDQIAHDGGVAAMVEEAVDPNGLNDLPPVVLPLEEPELESEDFLESMIAEDLDMDDHNLVE